MLDKARKDDLSSLGCNTHNEDDTEFLYKSPFERMLISPVWRVLGRRLVVLRTGDCAALLLDEDIRDEVVNYGGADLRIRAGPEDHPRCGQNLECVQHTFGAHFVARYATRLKKSRCLEGFRARRLSHAMHDEVAMGTDGMGMDDAYRSTSHSAVGGRGDTLELIEPILNWYMR